MIKVTCALVFQRNKLLIAQRGSDSDHPFEWEFPGGKIDPGETAEESVLREIAEELRVKIEIEKKLDTITFDYGFKKIELIPFLCTLKSGKIILSEHIDFRWIELEKLGDLNLAAADQKLISLEKNQAILKEYAGKNMDHPR